MRLLRQFWACDRTVQFLVLNHLAMMLGFSMVLPYVTGYLSTTLGFAASMVGLVLGLRTFSQQGLGVIGGILANLWVIAGTRSVSEAVTAGRLKSLTRYWVLVDIVWLVIFVGMYLK